MNQQSAQQNWLAVEGTKLYYETKGQGTPIIFLHAGIADSRMWDDQFDVFAEYHQVTRFDFRGFGNSVLTEDTFTHTGDLLHLYEHLNIEKAILVGASFGGAMSINFTLENPDKVLGLVLACAAVNGHSWSEDMQTYGDEEDALVDKGDLDAATECNVTMWVNRPGREGVSEAVCERVRKMQNRAYELQLAIEDDNDESYLPDALTRLKEIQMLSLVMIGEHDVVDMQHLAKRFSEDLNAPLIHFSGSAHLPNMEEPEKFNQVLSDFVKTL